MLDRAVECSAGLSTTRQGIGCGQSGRPSVSVSLALLRCLRFAASFSLDTFPRDPPDLPMIVKKSKRWIRFLKTTAIGGLLFLLPLIVLGALISQITPIVLSVAEFLHEHIPVKTATGIAFLISLSIAVIMLLCFAAGMVARWSIGQRVSKVFEKNLLLLFPRYAILKDQMADTIGGSHTRPQMKPVLVRLADRQVIGFETERSQDGGQVVVYLPGSPDSWAGSVAIVPADQVESLKVGFGEAVSICEQLGRGSLALIKKSQESQSTTAKATNDASPNA